PLAHRPGEQRLTEDVVDLVGAGVTEVLALEVDPRPSGVLGEPRREEQRRGPAGVIAQQPVEPGLERAVATGRRVRLLQLDERSHPGLRHEAAAEAAEAAGGVGPALHARRASSTKRRTLSGSLRPGEASTPESTSTPYGRTTATARATLSGVSPPERMIRAGS